MQITGTHHIALITANFATLRDFYVETLGLPIVGAFAGHNIIFIQAGSTTIELIERTGYTAPASGGWDHFAFTVDDVDAAYAELSARGVVFHVPPRSFPDPAEVRIAFFKDPDGNVLELVQPVAATYPQNGLK
jgi:catechol 2,3-dioxygenase-like lactoylglutathione lyase family enzyme